MRFFENVHLLGVRIDILDVDQLISFLISNVSNQNKIIIANANIHAINIAYEDNYFRKILNSSAIVFCDGFGVKLASRLIHKKKLYRYTPPDWFPVLANECSKKGLSMFFLGGIPGVTEKAANILKRENPEIRILGTHHGFFDKTITSKENLEVLKAINSMHPDILVVGFGMPVQEKWISENLQDLNIKVAIPVGALFDYISGDLYRFPSWMTDHGLEWLGRVVIEPGRLWKRYILGNPLFFWRLFKHHVLGLKLPDGMNNDEE